DTPRREVHDPKPGSVVVRVVDQAQVSKGMLDFLPFEESKTPVYAIRNSGREKCVLQDPRLCIAAIQNGDLAAAAAVIDQRADLFQYPLGFEQIRGLLRDAYRLPMPLIGPEILAEPGMVVGNQRI